jgi:hypothetical protein
MSQYPVEGELVGGHVGSAVRLRPAEVAHPAKLERRHGRDRRRAVREERIEQRPVVGQLQLLDAEAGSIIEILGANPDPMVRDPDGPEEAIGRDARVEVVLLMSVGRQRIYLILVDVESDECEGPLVPLAVLSDIFPLHEAVVAVEEQCRPLSGNGVTADTRALHRRDPGDAAVVEDRGWLDAGPEERMEPWRESAWNRGRSCPSASGLDQCREPE